MNKRRYTLRERAARQEATRRRIVEATAALHAEVGPAATTISAIAERAGVQRLTVYRHFPEERGLFEACSALNQTRHPPPDRRLWSEIDAPMARAEAALGAIYEYYAKAGPGLARVLRDAEDLPMLGEALAPFRAYLDSAAADLAARWESSEEHELPLAATIALALDYWGWRALAARGLAPAQAARLMARLIDAAAGGGAGGR